MSSRIDITPTTILAPFEAEHQAVNLTRNNKGSAWDRIGNNQLIDPDQWRYNYNPDTGIFEGRTIMGQWTQELFDVSDFSQSSWNKENSVSVGTDKGIKGTTENIKLTPDGTNNGRIRQDKTVSDNSNEHTVQVWLKKDMSSNAKVEAVLSGGTSVTVDVVVDTTDGSVVSGSATVEDDGDFWEVSFQITNNGTGNTTLSKRYYPDNANQTSAQTFDIPSVFLNRSSPPPTPVYGETAGQSYTQDPDIATVTDLDAINFNPSEGTFVVKVSTSDPQSSGRILQVSDGTSNNYIQLWFDGDVIDYIGEASDTNQWRRSTGDDFNANQFYDIAISYKKNSIKMAVDGEIVFTDDSAIIPPVERLDIGHNTVFSPNYLDGFMPKLMYYPRQVPDDKHKALTQ